MLCDLLATSLELFPRPVVREPGLGLCEAASESNDDNIFSEHQLSCGEIRRVHVSSWSPRFRRLFLSPPPRLCRGHRSSPLSQFVPSLKMNLPIVRLTQVFKSVFVILVFILTHCIFRSADDVRGISRHDADFVQGTRKDRRSPASVSVVVVQPLRRDGYRHFLAIFMCDILHFRTMV